MIAQQSIRCLFMVFAVCNCADLKPSVQRFAFLAFYNPGGRPSTTTSTNDATIKSPESVQNVSTITTTETNGESNDSSNSSVPDDIDPNRAIFITKSIVVPFSLDAAFDVFSTWPRHAEFNPYLRSVEYVIPPGQDLSDVDKYWGETKWHMSVKGLPVNWRAICTRLDRGEPPLGSGCIQWKSTSGMQNFGKILFERVMDDYGKMSFCNVTFTMTFVAPRLLASLFRRSGALLNFAQERMLADMLHNFREQIMEELAQGNEQQQQKSEEPQ